jgi:hypothetical protein
LMIIIESLYGKENLYGNVTLHKWIKLQMNSLVWRKKMASQNNDGGNFQI